MGQTVVIEDERRAEVADDFVTIYEVHYPRLVRALQIGGLDQTSAEDVAQEAFARTLGHWRRVRPWNQPARVRLPHGLPTFPQPLKREGLPAVERPALDDTAAEAVSNLGLEESLG